MTNKILACIVAALVAGCGNSSNNGNTDDMGVGGNGGSGGGGAGGGGGGMGGADMAGVVPCVCPTGYMCDGSGVCVGGNAQAIAINVKTVNVSGTITLNGAAPTTLPSCNTSASSPKATVRLVDSGRGYAFDLPVPCSASTFAWTGVVFPGTYKVYVSGDSNYSSLPSQAFAASSIEVAADMQNVALDVKTASVAGTVTLNGAAPTTANACSTNAGAAKATVHLVDSTDGYKFDLDVPCSSSTFAWSGVVFPGTYAVSVDGDVTYTNLPATPFIANSSLAVGGAVANQVLAVSTVNVAGSITLNGAAPTATCTTGTYAKATVHLADAKQGYRFDVPVPCSQSDFSWSASVYPGTYAVSVDDTYGYSNLPATAYVANSALSVQSSVSNQTLNVQTVTVGGTVTLNGTAPAQTQYCMSSPSSTQATVKLADAQQGYAFSFTVPCSSTTLAWSGDVFPGNYKISVAGEPSYSTLPTASYVANDGLAVTASASNVALDVKTANVGGTLMLNGAAPTSDPACMQSPSSTKAAVRLTDAKHGYAFDFNVPCSSSTFAWTGQVFPGTYVVSVAGSQYSNLPDTAFMANPSLTVSSDVMGQTLDVKTVAVGGTLALNGATPSSTTACNPDPTATKATIQFVDSSDGYSFAVPVACSSATFAWTGVVYPGTYRISVAGAGAYSNLPSEGFLVTPRLRVQ